MGHMSVPLTDNTYRNFWTKDSKLLGMQSVSVFTVGQTYLMNSFALFSNENWVEEKLRSTEPCTTNLCEGQTMFCIYSNSKE